MKSLIRAGLFLSGCLSIFSVNAFEVVAEFSADAVQSVPGRSSSSVKMFVSKTAVRTESEINGDMIIEIVYRKDKRRVLLNTLRKTYFEQNSEYNNSLKPDDTSSSPCRGIVNSKCKKLGDENINGRSAIKWEMTVHRNGQDYKSLHWLDKKYSMPLRNQFHDGTVSTMTLSEKENINGRDTEKWVLQSIRPNGQNIESQQWYDPKLKMVIREELPGGYVRELRNIKVAKQNNDLFSIPSDYKKDDMTFPGMVR